MCAGAVYVDIPVENAGFNQLRATNLPKIKMVWDGLKRMHFGGKFRLKMDKFSATRAKGWGDASEEVVWLGTKGEGHGLNRFCNNIMHTPLPACVDACHNICPWVIEQYPLAIGLLDHDANARCRADKGVKAFNFTGGLGFCDNGDLFAVDLAG